MLSQRTNLLLSPAEYAGLMLLSKKHDKTMGELIRHAIKQTYKITSTDKMADSLARIREMTKNVETKKIDYTEMIKSGRKYE